jgi:two-component system, chemotaxis family, chemotaxis protein CheY
MRILIAEDDLASRKYILKILEPYGECDFTVNGIETLDAFLLAADEKKPYDLICLDIMMPKADGMKVLKSIRQIEKQNGIADLNRVKIIMTTALNDTETINNSYDIGCEAFAAKPIDGEKLIKVIRKLGLL